ncbi:MAG: stage III sporulation protein AC [Firmicutes bacterium]|nr:stage III sporulation protein AC [Bacillota bacterium]MDY5531144.1 stage III sporulation protein AC [Pumilibacteraceae bacterium]
MDVSIIFKIAGVGIITAIVNQVLKKSDKEEIATLATLAGLIIVLFMIINLITQLFDGLKGIYTLFLLMRSAVCPYLK